jgi:predicted RNA-binding Zn-ribbon protein involved in translation (DUF1610 family)
MNTGLSLMQILVAAAYAFILIELALVAAVYCFKIIEAVLKYRKPVVCICGHRFVLPKIGQYICPKCGKRHLSRLLETS